SYPATVRMRQSRERSAGGRQTRSIEALFGGNASCRHTHIPQQGRHHFVRIEKFLRDRARTPRVDRVVTGDEIGASYGLLERTKRHQAAACRVVAAESRILHESRLAGCQVADGPIAEPSRLGLDVDPLRD